MYTPCQCELSILLFDALESGKRHNSEKVLLKCLSTSAAASPRKCNSKTPLGLNCVCTNSMSAPPPIWSAVSAVSSTNSWSVLRERILEDSTKFSSSGWGFCIFVHEFLLTEFYFTQMKLILKRQTLHILVIPRWPVPTTVAPKVNANEGPRGRMLNLSRRNNWWNDKIRERSIVKILSTKENCKCKTLTYHKGLFCYYPTHFAASDWFVIKLQLKKLKNQLSNFLSTSTGNSLAKNHARPRPLGL